MMSQKNLEEVNETLQYNSTLKKLDKITKPEKIIHNVLKRRYSGYMHLAKVWSAPSYGVQRYVYRRESYDDNADC